ncbi:GNAT family N-acetyltransferase [Jeotgalibacillus sp. R-1-5s-1]|uniref:GNAT family N-acetyltransferase n=1 Tax=Jeotgalibacillus sp. R-1-5s-1 TaxID=2555897 RepID=UPI00106C7FF9|nr:GNAT family N-acetyltransferase [Jeotgalibacillus sp. R-1-5s-1]TFD94423.1 N-acetyltransferase [Jeotgalibacillus sp. R-1-5s-1]
MQTIELRPIKLTDFDEVLRWSRDEAFCSANEWPAYRDRDELLKWWETCVTNESEDFMRLGITLDDRLIGYADLACITERSAEIGIAIGDSTLWGQGIGFRAAKRLMDHASVTLGVEMLNAETHEHNVRSRKMFERLGFEEVGRQGAEEWAGKRGSMIEYRVNLQ